MTSDVQKRRKDDQWHVGKTIDIGHILTTIVMVVVGFLYVSDMKTDIEVLKTKQLANSQFITEVRSDIKEIKNMLYELKD